MPTNWNDYLAAARAADAYRVCHDTQGAAFAPLRGVIGRVFEASGAETVACLGAGVLNDIPYAKMVRAGAALHLVDWLPGAVESGIGWSIIGEGSGGGPECVYCSLGDEKASAYCRSYRPPGGRAAAVCESFAPPAEAVPGCEAFTRGELPHVRTEDVTGGYASAFAERVLGELEGVGSWRQALGRANALAKQVRRHRTSLSIAAGSVDLVVSSMLLSQFEHEPYTFFSRQAAKLLGPPRTSEEKRLRPALESLRSTLLKTQIEHHCAEIERLLGPGGRCLMTFEMFTHQPALGRWTLVPEMHEALARLAKRFHFDLGLLDAADGTIAFEGRDGPSRVLCLVLRAA